MIEIECRSCGAKELQVLHDAGESLYVRCPRCGERAVVEMRTPPLRTAPPAYAGGTGGMVRWD